MQNFERQHTDGHLKNRALYEIGLPMTQAKRPDEVARKALLRALQTRPADPVRTSLRELYQPIVDEPLPDEIRALLDRLEQEND